MAVQLELYYSHTVTSNPEFQADHNTLLIIANSIAIRDNSSHTLAGDVPTQHSDPCTQEDFLFVASVLVDKVELSDLSTSLKVPLDNVDDNDTERNKRKQIVKILLHWQFMNSSDSSKAKLLESLQTLNNYSDVEEVLKPYLGL